MSGPQRQPPQLIGLGPDSTPPERPMYKFEVTLTVPAEQC